MDASTIDKIKALGYRVFVPANPVPGLDTYCYYVDGTRIGYAQADRSRSAVTTVHKANFVSGTGFLVADAITGESLRTGLTFAPQWARASDRNSVRKFKDWEEFEAQNFCKLIEV